MRLKIFIFFLALPTLVACNHAPVRHVQSEGSWQVVVENTGKSNKLCFAGAIPMRSGGSLRNRESRPYLMATRRGSGDIEISASSGYPYMRGSKVELAANNAMFGLFFINNVAWAHNNAEDKRIITALEAAENDEIEIRGVSHSGLTSIDYYPVTGLAAAIQRLKALCP